MISFKNIRAALSSTQTLARDDRGLSTVEYVIVLVLIAAIAMGAWNQFGESVVLQLEGAQIQFDENVNLDRE